MVKKRRLIYSDSASASASGMNELSDDVLVLILSKLTMKEAARTNVLSHRWENLWVYYTGSLNFYRADATPDTDLNEITIERPKLISWVNHVLDLHRGSNVDEFRVCFELNESNGDDIRRWIKFAIDKRVSKFELDFSQCYGFFIKWHDCFRFPSKLLDSPCNLLSPFGSLTSLRLISVDVSDEVVVYFVSNCQSLEHLSIKGSSSLTNINATTALKLKCLEIEMCPGLENVDISNTNLESLKFEGNWETKSSLKKLHLLSEVSLDGRWCYRVVRFRFAPLPISQLQSLELDLSYYIWERSIKFPEEFPTLCNLKHWKVSILATYDQNIFCLTSLICECPILSNFTLKVRYEEPSISKPEYELPKCEWRMSEKRIHECLKVVEYIGFYGYESDVDLVYYLLEKSKVLEKVIIDPKLFFICERDEKIEKVSRDRAKLLQKYVPPGTEYVIL